MPFLFSVTFVGFGRASTRTFTFFTRLLSVVTEMVVSPFFTGLTRPFWSTVATRSLVEFQNRPVSA